VHAIDCIRKLVTLVCDDERHTNVVVARKSAAKGEFLVTRLADLVSFAFNAVSSVIAPVRLGGLHLLVDVLKVSPRRVSACSARTEPRSCSTLVQAQTRTSRSRRCLKCILRRWARLCGPR